MNLFTDASSFGLGAFWYFGGDNDWRQRTNEVTQHSTLSVLRTHIEHINVAETRAVLAAMSYWQGNWSNCRLVVHTDNTTVLGAINKTTVRGPANNLLRQILLYCIDYNIAVSARWLSSKDNALADALSRMRLDLIADFCPNW